jgi:cell division septal protein FtsQ
MQNRLTLRPRNYKHRRARVLLALAAELCALVALALLCVWYVASR